MSDKTLFEIVLFEPEIPPNTGNIIRLCANTGARLHLIRPLGFQFDDRHLRRAGLDYQQWAKIQLHRDFSTYLDSMQPQRLLAFTTKARHNYATVSYRRGDTLLFGSETRGLPGQVLQSIPIEQRLRIPMLTTGRSLNLSNAVAIALYEAWRQQRFIGT